MNIDNFLLILFKLISLITVFIGLVSYLSKLIAEKYITSYFEKEKVKFQHELMKELEIYKLRHSRIYSEQIKSIEELYKITASLQNKLAYLMESPNGGTEDLQIVFREIFDQRRELKQLHNLRKIYFSEELNSLIESYNNYNVDIFSGENDNTVTNLTTKKEVFNGLIFINQKLVLEFRRIIGT